ncbi:MAG: leucyl aminopeptidase, partial [Gammaproteobacteria bacterium]
MEFHVKSGNPEKQRTACVIVGVFEARRLSSDAARLDEATDGLLSLLVRRGDIDGKPGQSLLLHHVPGALCERVLLLGCGREREFSDQRYFRAVAKAAGILDESGATEAVSYLPDLNVKGRDIYWKVRQCVQITADTLYRFDRFKSKTEPSRRPLKRLVMAIPSRRDLSGGERAIRDGQAIVAGVQLAKDLGNLPGNICTPSYLADQAKELCQGNKKLKVQILEEKDMERLGMGAFLSVSRGSREPAKLIVMNYKGGTKDQKPVVLVGKGITFDSGGISIKPSSAMDEMKFDMCGAASVLGTLNATLELKLPINVIGVIASAENLPDGNASKPGDIVTSMSGQTIEILNTDAEGRLVLCDALSYSER